MPEPIPTLRWTGELPGVLELIDQTALPLREVVLACTTAEDVWGAIRRLAVRGAPAIGIAAAYGVVLGVQHVPDHAWDAELSRVAAYLATSRPTAVNLFWALERMKRVARGLSGPARERSARMLTEAGAIHDEDRRMCHAIGTFGAALVPDGARVLTHCNAGGLATSELGTALAVIYKARDAGKRVSVYADETRPLLQGARLTAYELVRAGIPTTLICDNMAAQVMKEGRVDLVVVGADRIAANGDAANKIGTYGVAVLAHAHGIPFYVAAPSSTFDLSLATGDAIPIEQRSGDEITEGYFAHRIAPAGVETYAPAFDVTPARLIAAIVTEKGVLRPPFDASIARALGGTTPTAR